MADESDAGDMDFMCAHLPCLRGERDNFFTTPVIYPEMDRIYKSGSAFEVEAALTYLQMRAELFEGMERQGANLRHVNLYEIEAARVWWTKLKERQVVTDSARFSRRGKFVPQKVPKVVSHPWLN